MCFTEQMICLFLSLFTEKYLYVMTCVCVTELILRLACFYYNIPLSCKILCEKNFSLHLFLTLEAMCIYAKEPCTCECPNRLRSITRPLIKGVKLMCYNFRINNM